MNMIPGPWRIAEEVGAPHPYTVYLRRNGASTSSQLESMRDPMERR